MEMKKKFLIYMDILGFKDLPHELAKGSRFNVDTIRETFLSKPIKEKIKKLTEKCSKITTGISAIEGSDNYVLLVDYDIDILFRVIAELAITKIPHEDYSHIPLEIAIDLKDIEITVEDPINQNEVIDFLKNDIITPYRKKYKEIHGKQSIIKETFILFTPSAFEELREHQKKECEKYNYSKKDIRGNINVLSYYFLPLRVAERERKISDFLEEIHQLRSDYAGALIDKVFVPPDEFNEIKKILENERIVFLTGPAGYGKTYTAIRLLWEWFNDKGYTPRWVSGKEESDRKEVRNKLANIDAELKPRHVIYFEDPFGKTIYERRDDLKERINFIVATVKKIKDVYIIITSRKDVFEEFERESYSVEEIKKFENELNILRPAYSYEKRKEILAKWAEEKGCEWFKESELKQIVFESLKNKEILPIPLSIHDFTQNTVKINEESELKKETIKYSRAAEKAFADEIKDFCKYGREDRVLFLSFIFISQEFSVSFVKEVYEKIKTTSFKGFEAILEEEKRVKIGKSPGGVEIITFSHPLYANTLSYILSDSSCNGIFCEVLKKLSLDDYASHAVAKTVIENFDELPDEVGNLLFILSENDNYIYPNAVAWTAVNNFDKLPDRVRNELLITLFKNDSAFDVIRMALERIVDMYFDKLPGKISELLLTLSVNNNAAGCISKVLKERFHSIWISDKISNELLLTLSKNNKAVGNIAWVVVNYFNRLPADSVRNELLLTLSKNNKTASDVAWVVAKHFDKLPDKIKNILFVLSENNSVSDFVPALAWNFGKLSVQDSNLLQKIIKNLLVRNELLQLIHFLLFSIGWIDSVRNFILETLNILRADKDITISKKASETLMKISDDVIKEIYLKHINSHTLFPVFPEFSPW